MADFNQGVEALKRFAVQFQGMAELGAALEQIGSIDGAIKTAKSDLAKANKEAAQAAQDLGEARVTLKAAKDEAAAVLLAAQEFAAASNFAANDDAAAIKADAKAAGADLLAKAKAKADAVAEASARAQAAAAQDLADMKGQAKDAQAQRNAAQVELDELTAKLAAAREAVAAMLK